MEVISTKNCPSLDQHQIQELKKEGIRRLIDIIQSGNREKIMAAVGEYGALKDHVLSLIRPQPVSGTQLALQSLNRNRPLWATGIEGLDTILRGGLHEGEILEFFGDVGSGKTQMCTSICAQFLKEGQSVVAYFDLKANFSAKRLLEYCGGRKDLLRNIRIVRPFGMAQLMDVFSKMQGMMSNEKDEFHSKLRLMVFDSVPTIIYPVVGQNFQSWRYWQEKFVEMVVSFAQRGNDGGIVVIFVNHATTKRPDFNRRQSTSSISSGSSNPIVKPAMGSSYWPHKVNFSVHLKKSSGSNNPNSPSSFHANLCKSSRTESSQSFKFAIEKNKIQCTP